MISLSFQGCQEATSPEIVETSDQISSLKKISTIELNDLDLLSKHLALALDNEQLRGILRNATQNANTREHILDAKMFLEKDIELSNNIISSFQKEILSRADGIVKNKLNKIFSKIKEGEIDIYFPVHSHLENLDVDNTELMVGYTYKAKWRQ